MHGKSASRHSHGQTNVWDDHYHFGKWGVLESVGIPMPYNNVTEDSMKQWAQMAVKHFDLKVGNGIQLSTRESHERHRANKLLKTTAASLKRMQDLKMALDARAQDCITMVGRNKPIEEAEAMEIIR